MAHMLWLHRVIVMIEFVLYIYIQSLRMKWPLSLSNFHFYSVDISQNDLCMGSMLKKGSAITSFTLLLLDSNDSIAKMFHNGIYNK